MTFRVALALNSAAISVCAFGSWRLGLLSNYLGSADGIWVESPRMFRLFEALVVLFNLPSWLSASSAGRLMAEGRLPAALVYSAWFVLWLLISVPQLVVYRLIVQKVRLWGRSH